MLKVLSILAFIVVLAALVIFASPLFNIKNVEAQTDNNCVSPASIKNSGILGQNLLTFSTTNLVSSIKSKYSCAQELVVTKRYPSTLKVTIKTLFPLAKIDGTNFLISSQNLVSTGSGAGLPVVFLADAIPLKVGTAIDDPQLLFVSHILSQLKDSDFSVSSIRVIDPGNIIVYNRENALVIFSSNQDLARQIGALQEVIAKSKIDATKIQKIDLRFDMPVIVFK